MLPLPASEVEFWTKVGKRLVIAPGLILAVVPYDLNTQAIRSRLRQLICDPSDDHELRELAPDGRQVFSVDFGTEGECMLVQGAEVLPHALAKHGFDKDLQHAELGDEPVYLLLNGITVPPDMSLSQWARSLTDHWPGGRVGGTTTSLHCCCIVSTEQPSGQAPLPEGCDWLAPEPAPNEEIRAIVRAGVDDFWRDEDPCVRQYLCSGVADMASGQRLHAERALETLREEWQDGQSQQAGWRPMWRPTNQFVEQVRSSLQGLGINEDWVRERLSEGVAGQYADDQRLANRLWVQGLWRSIGDNTSLWQGLTMVARASLQTPQSLDWLLHPAMADATAQVLVHTLRVERQLKHHMLRLMQSRQFHGAVDRALAERRRNEDRSYRAYILEEIGRIPGFWEARFPYIPPEQRHSADVLISVCSFGTLEKIVYHLLPTSRYDGWRASLREVINARNTAAHGGWFSLAEYKTVVQSATRVETELASLRFA